MSGGADEEEAGWGRGEGVVHEAVGEDVAEAAGSAGRERDGAASETQDAPRCFGAGGRSDVEGATEGKRVEAEDTGRGGVEGCDVAREEAG